MAASYVKDLPAGGNKAIGATSVSLTIPAGGVAAGHAIVVIAVTSATDTCTVSDSAGNTYTQDASTANGTAVGVRVFSCLNCAALTAGQTITITYTTSHTYVVGFAREYTGLPSSVAVSATAANTNTGTALDSGTGTVGDGDVVIGAWGLQTTNVTTTYTAGSGFTDGASVNAVNGTLGRDIFTEHQIGAAAGSESAQATGSISHVWAGVLVAYRAANVSGAATGAIAITGSAAGTMQFSASATGAVTVSGSASGSLRLSGAATGAVVVTGSAAGTLRLAGGTANGAVSVAGTASGALRFSAAATAGAISISGFAATSSAQQLLPKGVSFAVVAANGSSTAAPVTNGSSEAAVTKNGSSKAVVIRNGQGKAVVY